MQGQPVLLFTKAVAEEAPGTLTGTPRPTQQAPWITSVTCSGSSGFSTASLWGKRTTASRWGNARFTGTESALTWPSGLLFQNLGLFPTPNRALIATEGRRRPGSYLALALPLHLQPHLPPRQWLPAHPGKDVACVQLRPSFPTTATGQTDFIGTSPHKDVPSRQG